MPSGVLNGDQIANLARKHGLPLKGVLMSGQLSSTTSRPSVDSPAFYVFNMDRHPNGRGTHWIAAYCAYPHCIYFDSFGYPPNIPIQEWLRRSYSANNIHYNHKEIQDYYSDNCGEWCIAFGAYIKTNMGRNYNQLYNVADDFLSEFSKDTKHNELMLSAMHI